MRVILNELKRNFPKDEFEFKEYNGSDRMILKLQKSGTGCYNLVKNGKRLSVVLYDFNFYRRHRLRDEEEVFELMIPLVRLIELKYK